MTADNDGVLPARDQTGDARNDNRFAEDGSSKDITDSTVRRQPHCTILLARNPADMLESEAMRTLLQFEFLHSLLIGCDGGAFDANRVLLNGFSSIDGNLIVGLITIR